MRVSLMLTCLCDAFYGEVGIATTRVLEHAGCQVEFPESQTCCGQPPFNAGDWPSAKSVAGRCLAAFAGQCPVVTPSASCAAMLRDGYPMLGLNPPKVFELSELLLDELRIDRWPLNGSSQASKGAAAFHRACHGRALGLGDRQERLLKLAGWELVALAQEEQCCGFGGAFSATHGALSSGIGVEKLRHVVESGAELLASGDMGCLMHLQGLIERHNFSLRTAHYCELLAEAISA